MPADYDTTGVTRYPLMVVHDGNDYLNFCRMARVLDYLIDNGRMEPMIAAFVPPASGSYRTQEYGTTLRQEYIYFIAEELIPHIDSAYHTDPHPESRATIGDSYGGNISLQLAASHPELFGHAAGQSPYVSSELQALLDVSPSLSLDIWVDIGTYDIDLLKMQVNNTLVPILQNRGYDYELRKMHEGHSWGNWRKNLQPILVRFFPGVNASKPEMEHSSLPSGFQLLSNHPNPFNGTTVLRIQLSKKGWARLAVYDLLGRQVAVLREKQFEPGRHEFPFNAGILASGTYIALLETDGLVEARRITLIK
ncbi:MAG: alpha/beta hydrolase-fold protein [bacterium]